MAKLSPAFGAIGARFGRLVVAEAFQSRRANGKNRAKVRCVCDCGNEKTTDWNHIVDGCCRSCGCLNSELSAARKRTHGKSGTPESTVWHCMRQRCSDRNHPAFKDYGGRGILVCERWNDFAAFLTDMGTRPSPSHTIERVDNDRGYSPDNCVWLPRHLQSRNRRCSVRVEYRGDRMLAIDALAIAGTNISRSTVTRRLASGMAVASAVEIPRTPNGHRLPRVLARTGTE